MTAKQALIRCADMATRSWDQCVYDDHGYAHWVTFKTEHGIDRLSLGSDSPNYPPFSTIAEPYRFEDMTND